MLTSLPSRRRVIATLAAPLALALVLAMTLFGPADPSHARRVSDKAAESAATLEISPARPMKGERTVFRGKLSGKGRPVALQQQVNGRWSVVDRAKVSKKGTYRLKAKVRKKSKFRVQAPASHGRKAWSSGVRKVRIAQQKAVVTGVEAPFAIGFRRTVTAQVSPVRKGRTVALQRRTGGKWKDVATATTDSNGVARPRYQGTTAGKADYRVVAGAFRGAKATTSSQQGIRTASVTELASPGAPAAAESFAPSISADGRWVAFTSDSHLLPADVDAQNDIYLFDRVSGGLTLLMANANSHVNSPRLSGDGRFLAFQSLASNLATEADSDYDVFVLDRATGALDLISATPGGEPGNGNSYAYDISDDGRFVAFTSTADDLVTNLGPPDTSTRHAYVRDRTSGLNRGLDRIGLGWATSNIYGVDLSGDGTAVAFQNGDDGLDPGHVDDIAIFRWQITAAGAITDRVNLTPDIKASMPSLDRTGDTLAFTADEGVVPADLNALPDAYVRTPAGAYELVTPVGAGKSETYDLSPDGRYVAVSTRVVLPGDTNGNDFDVVVWDRSTSTYRLLTKGGPGFSAEPRFGADGSVVVFGSGATGLAPATTGDYNVFTTILR